MDSRKIFSSNLKQITAYKKIVYADMAKTLKLNPVRFQNYLDGKEFPNPSELKKIADYLSVPVRLLTAKLDEKLAAIIKLLIWFEEISEENFRNRFSLSKFVILGLSEKSSDELLTAFASEFDIPLSAIQSVELFEEYISNLNEKLHYLYDLDDIDFQNKENQMETDIEQNYRLTQADNIIPNKSHLRRMVEALGLSYHHLTDEPYETYLHNLFFFVNIRRTDMETIAKTTGLPLHCIAGFFHDEQSKDDTFKKDAVIRKVSEYLKIDTLCLTESVEYLNDISLFITPESSDPLLRLSSEIKQRNVFSVYSYEKERLSCIQSLSIFLKDLVQIDILFPYLKQLKVLNITGDYSEGQEIPEDFLYDCSFFSNFPNLIQLKLTRCMLKQVPEWIQNLNQLQYLDLSENQLEDIPSWITECVTLNTLIIDGNNISELPSQIGKLINLKHLNVSNNAIQTIPESLAHNQSLSELILSSNKIQELPDWIGAFPELKHLDISDLSVQIIPYSLIQSGLQFDAKIEQPHLIHINKLDLFAGMSTLYSTYKIGSKTLHIPHNPFGEDLIVSLGSKKLPESLYDFLDCKKIFYPENNDFGQIVSEPIQPLKNSIIMHHIRLSQQDPALFQDNNRELIEAWYQAHYFNQMITVREAKVIFLGDGDAGKTYSIQRMMRGGEREDGTNTIEFQTDVTYGISIHELNTDPDNDENNIKLRIWDFGGQAIMHSMHRCFLTDDTCYVIVISTRNARDQMEQARYWLRNVQAFAKDVPVIVYVNRWSRMADHIDIERLREEFPTQLKSDSQFVFTNAKLDDRTNFMELQNGIIDAVKNHINYKREIPITWNNTRNRLTEMAHKERRFCINESEYIQVCIENGIVLKDDEHSRNLQIQLLSMFNILGVCFSYHLTGKKEPVKDYKVLNPEWLTNAIYLLITLGEEQADHGLLKNKTIQTILSNPELGESGSISFMKGVRYEADQSIYIREIMRKFRLSYDTSDGEFIPALCSGNRPKNLKPVSFNPDIHTHVTYFLHYQYLPDTILQRLIIENKEYRTMSEFWTKGFCIRMEDLGLTIIVDSGNGRDNLMIDVYALKDTMPYILLPRFRRQLLQINEELGLEAEEYIVGYRKDKSNEFKVLRLLNLKKHGSEFADDDNGDILYKIDDLLEAIYGKESVKALSAAPENVINSLDPVLNTQERMEYEEKILMKNIRNALTSIQQIDLYHGSKIKENDMNDFIAKILNVSYTIKDQPRLGRSYKGFDAGLPDIEICRNEEPLAIFEGQYLTSVRKDSIQEHVDKLILYYNPNGLPFLCHTVYYRGKNFVAFWERYANHLSTVYQMPLNILSGFEEISEQNSAIRHARIILQNNGKCLYIHFFVIKMDIYEDIDSKR